MTTFPPTINDSVAALLAAGQLRGWGNALGENYKDGWQSPNYWHGRPANGVRCVVWHIADGTLNGTMDWLTNPVSEASSNDVISREGVVYNLVPGKDTPWTNGKVREPNMDLAIVRQAVATGVNPNGWSYTIECIGYSTGGRPGALTDPQTAALILRTAQACMVHRLTADRQHIMRHSDWDSVTRKNCPGYSEAEMLDWIGAVRQICAAWRGW